VSDCIEFEGYRNRLGYGVLGREGRVWLAHRWVWTQQHGPISPGVCVLHRCDNPPCINLEHLFTGTHADNMADMKAKGRARRGPGPYPGVPGERNSHAKLTEADVRAVRARLAAGESRKALCNEYGLSQSAMSSLARGETWTHVK
jgi:hypothetical protein